MNQNLKTISLWYCLCQYVFPIRRQCRTTLSTNKAKIRQHFCYMWICDLKRKFPQLSTWFLCQL